MSEQSSLCAIYDFELLPYALGDVLTWNVQTAIRAVEAGCSQVDVYVCVDRKHPSSIYQRDLVVPENCELFFHELFGAFGTHPMLGSMHVYRDRDEMLEALEGRALRSSHDAAALTDYKRVLGHLDSEAELNRYFIQYVYSHERLN